jgi:hypothetical protein
MPYRFRIPDNMDNGARKLISVSICSDGISSYVDENKKGIGLEEVVPELVNYKNFTGEFVKKRMFFFNKKMISKKCHHYDDVSCGTIYLPSKEIE